MDNPYVAHAFAGIRIVVAALIAEAVFSLWKKAVRRKTDWAVFLLALAALLAFNLSPIVIVLLAAAVGLAQYWQERHK